MPAETHQCGSVADRDEVISLFSALLGDRAAQAPEGVTLASLGVDDDYALGDLWDAVRDEFGERSLGPTNGFEELECTMTVAAAAARMSWLLGQGRAEPRDHHGPAHP